jgi:hypothetical protein
MPTAKKRRKLFARRRATARYTRRAVPPQWRRLADHGDQWTLYHQSDKGGWHNFVLRHHDNRFRKYHYWGAWDGQRVARNGDLGRLARLHPEIYRWLERTCRDTWTRPQPSAS